MNTFNCPACGCSDTRAHDTVLACNNCGNVWTPDLHSLKSENAALREAHRKIVDMESYAGEVMQQVSTTALSGTPADVPAPSVNQGLVEALENLCSDFEDWTAFKDPDQWETLQNSLSEGRKILSLAKKGAPLGS